jgi:cytochrome c-type biogenesis protein CcmH
VNAGTTQLWPIAAALALGVLAIILWPVFKRGISENAPREAYDINVYKDQLLEIEADLERGLLNKEQGVAARNEIKRRILAAADNKEPIPEAANSTSRILTITVLILLVPLSAVFLYLHLGSPYRADQPLAGRALEAITAKSEAHEKIRQSSDDLVSFLKKNPENLPGWTLLARTYLSMGRYPDSAMAYAKAYQLSGESAELAVDYGEALTLAADTEISEKAHSLFAKALTANNMDPKARYYLGMFRAQQDDFRGALQVWIDLLTMSPLDAPWVSIVNQKIVRVVRTSGIDPASITPSIEALAIAKDDRKSALVPAPTMEDVKEALGMPEEDRNQMIRSMVERLAGKMKDDPNNKEGWLRLERAYRVLGDVKKADEAAAFATQLP